MPVLRQATRISLAAGIALALPLLVSCTTARTVTLQPGAGGVVAISPRDNPEARTKGETLMRQNCRGKRFRVVEEGETVVGTKSSNESTSSPSSTTNIFTGKKTQTTSTSGSSESRDVTEWRIRYVCGK